MDKKQETQSSFTYDESAANQISQLITDSYESGVMESNHNYPQNSEEEV
ncbi:hypothetical protein [Bacillus sp. HMF5848]|nr:hypothetical protein [Bacillus sp. HMF5848]